MWRDMQTFLPYLDFARSARSLDDARLGKQIIEGFQILRAAHEPSKWERHPVMTAWRGSDRALYNYLVAIHNEWQHRNGRQHGAFRNGRKYYLDQIGDARTTGTPWWLGSRAFHLSHQFNLARKAIGYACTFHLDLERVDVTSEPYLWPVRPEWFQVGTKRDGESFARRFEPGRYDEPPRLTGQQLLVHYRQADEVYGALFEGMSHE